jgi:hypothetical protein
MRYFKSQIGDIHNNDGNFKLTRPIFALKMSLEVLQWSKESREDVNFVMEGKVYFNQPTESAATSNWRRMVGNARANAVSALLVTLGKNGLEPPTAAIEDTASLQFPKDTGVKEAALLLVREKNNRYTMVRVSSWIRSHDSGAPKFIGGDASTV